MYSWPNELVGGKGKHITVLYGVVNLKRGGKTTTQEEFIKVAGENGSERFLLNSGRYDYYEGTSKLRSAKSLFWSAKKLVDNSVIKDFTVPLGYALDKKFTRAEGAVMVLRLFGLEASAPKANLRSSFSDVKDSHWASKYVAYAYQKGIIRGTGAATFSPDREMSGKEFVTLTLRALDYAEAEPKTGD